MYVSLEISGKQLLKVTTGCLVDKLLEEIVSLYSQ